MMPARELNSLADVILSAMRAGRQTAMGIAVALSNADRVVPEGGAAELSRLQALMNAQPAELTVPQIEALIDAGNGALADYYHDRACACRDYPEGCATNPQYRRAGGFWDTDAFAVGAPAVIGLWEVMRVADTTGEVAVLNAALAQSKDRIAELEGSLRQARADHADAHDDLVHALGRDAGMEWSDLIDIATTAMRTAEGLEAVGAKALRDRVAELEAERHTTNEALSQAAEQVADMSQQLASANALMDRADKAVRADGRRIAELEADSSLLAALEAAGVDNWDGYDEAVSSRG